LGLPSSVPSFVKHDQQDALTARWTKAFPIFQSQSLAELAGYVISDTLHQIPDIYSTKWTVVDFGSGRGGPVPIIETLTNHGWDEPQRAIEFRLSDIKPDLDVWMTLASQSHHLSFVPQPVDAANPGFSVISDTTPGDKEAALRSGFSSNGSKVFRLYCDVFHQFDDPMALKVIESTFQTSDGFAIIDSRERRIMSFLAVLVETAVTLLCTLFWFWDDPTHLVFTYLIPLLPVIQYIDGIVGCLRRRSYEEMLSLSEAASGHKAELRKGGGRPSFVCGDWTFHQERHLHTWPLGYMSIVVGTKTIRTSD
jgi:hypothetical protein